MRLVKICSYCATNINVLPTFLYTPLYTEFTELDGKVYGSSPKPVADHTVPASMRKSGWRLAFKLWNYHLGIEVHYDYGKVWNAFKRDRFDAEYEHHLRG